MSCVCKVSYLCKETPATEEQCESAATLLWCLKVVGKNESLAAAACYMRSESLFTGPVRAESGARGFRQTLWSN